jgi:hypothetical protein
MELPADAGTVQIVPQVLSTDDSGFIVSGVGTTSTFDEDVTIYLWTSLDGIQWTVDRVADMGSEFTYTEIVASVDGATVLLAQVSDGPLLAFEQRSDKDGWDQVDLTPVLADQAGIDADMRNVSFVGANVADGQLSVWWSFNNGNLGDVFEQTTAVVRRTGPNTWEATAISGIAPVTMTVTTGGFIGTAHRDNSFFTTPAATSIVASADGIEWQEISRFDGVALGTLVETGPGEFIASGVETAIHDDGYVNATGSGIWRITLTDSLDAIIRAGD